MMLDVKIEIADKNDAEEIAKISYQVAKLHDDSVPEYFKSVSDEKQLQNIKDTFDCEQITVFKATYKDKICGFLFLEITHRESEGKRFCKVGQVLNFGVDEVFRGKGIGQKMLLAVEDFSIEQGCEALDLSVFAFNQQAIKLYERLGYKIMDINMRKIL